MDTLAARLKKMPAHELRQFIERQLVSLTPSCPFESGNGEIVVVNTLAKIKGIRIGTAQELYLRAKGAYRA